MYSNKTLRIAALALALALPVAAQITHSSQCNSTYTGGQNETSWSCVLNVSAGALVTVSFNCNCSTPPSMTVTGDGSTLPMAGDDGPSPPSANFMALFYLCGAAANSSASFAITLGAAQNYGAIQVETWTGVATSSCYVASSYGWQSAGGGGKVAYSATAGQLVYAATNTSGTTAGAGFTLLNAPANEETDEQLIAASTTSGNATFGSVQVIQAAVFAPGSSTPCVPTLALLGVGGKCG